MQRTRIEQCGRRGAKAATLVQIVKIDGMLLFFGWLLDE